MHALKGSDPLDPTAPFSDQGVIGTPDENYAIHVRASDRDIIAKDILTRLQETVLHNYNGANYFIWSGKASRDTGTTQYLYIYRRLRLRKKATAYASSYGKVYC
jgi:hypothetical protein